MSQIVTGVYRFKNGVSNKAYVGSAVNIVKRRYRHLEELQKGTHHSVKLQRAWNKYPSNSWSWDILEVCDRNDLIKREQYWIDALSASTNGYNIQPKAGSPAGVIQTEEHRANISKSLKGRTFTEEHKARLSASAKNRDLSYLRTPEIRAKAAGTHKGRKNSEETKKLMSESAKRRSKAVNLCLGVV